MWLGMVVGFFAGVGLVVALMAMVFGAVAVEQRYGRDGE
jgi:hypothetical protein